MTFKELGYERKERGRMTAKEGWEAKISDLKKKNCRRMNMLRVIETEAEATGERERDG